MNTLTNELIEINDIFCELKNTTSLNYKKKILIENDSELLRSVLYFIFNPFIKTGISNKKIKNYNYSRNIEKEIYSNKKDIELSYVLDYFKTYNTGRLSDLKVLFNSIDLVDDSIEQYEKIVYLLLGIITKNIQLGCSVNVINSVYDNLIPVFKVQKGYPYEDSFIEDGELIFISRKLNGVRGCFINGNIYTEQGNLITGLDHIIEAIDRNAINDFYLEGELLYINEEWLSENEAFRKCAGIINSKKIDKTEIFFKIFDILPKEDFENKKSYLNYSQRKKFLNRIITSKSKYISIVDFLYEGNNKSKITECLNVALSNNWEGIMVNRDTPYRFGRTKNLLKVKLFLTCDLMVIGFEEGENSYSGTLGSFIVDYKGNPLNVPVHKKSERIDFWNRRDELLGRVIEVKYKEISHDKTGKESIQFPSFVCLRDEGKEISYN